MKKQQKPILVLAIIITFLVAVLFLPKLLSAGSLPPPPDAVDLSGVPVPTMKTLDEIYKLVAPLPTGFLLWSDNTRFAVCDEGTPDIDSDDVVLDRATGLMWSRDANLDGRKIWQDAMDYCDSLYLGRKTDWRLPTIEELTSLSKPYPSYYPALPEGHPFINVQSSVYWSSTTYANNTAHAWLVFFTDGLVNSIIKDITGYVWCVRGGHDAY